MTEQKFIPMYDLDALTEPQRQQYYLDACAHLHVPPELNVLAFQYMDSGDGARKLVLYIKKGATDIIRENQGIDTVSLVGTQIGGSVVYTATGRNKNGRTEIAVGAKTIEGLRGQALDSAIMTAQTRATRRMTLQFAGGGFLDENEVKEAATTTDIASAPSLAKVAAQPSVAPSSAPGKDITETKAATPISASIVPATSKNMADFTRKLPAAIEEAAKTVLAPSAEKPKRRSRKKDVVSFDKPFSLSPSADIPKSQSSLTHECPGGDHEVCTQEAINTTITNAMPLVTAPGVLTHDSLTRLPSGVFSPEPPFTLERLDPDKAMTHPIQTAVQVIADQAVEQVAKELLPQEHVIPNLPDQTQMKGFRDELFRYTNDVLPKAGMVPSEIGGGVGMKVRTFVDAKYKVPMNQLSLEQWQDFFSYMKGIIDNNGAEALVKFIDDVAEGRVKL